MLNTGAVVGLRCEGDVPGDRWLDGRTSAGSTGLSPSPGGNFTGSRWQVSDAGGGAIGLACLGADSGMRWLDGHTGDGSVHLAPSLGGGFSGTRWSAQDAGDGCVNLQCLGTIPGDKWLDGRTENGQVGLASNPGPPFSGTKWKVVSLAAIGLGLTQTRSDTIEHLLDQADSRRRDNDPAGARQIESLAAAIGNGSGLTDSQISQAATAALGNDMALAYQYLNIPVPDDVQGPPVDPSTIDPPVDPPVDPPIDLPPIDHPVDGGDDE